MASRLVSLIYFVAILIPLFFAILHGAPHFFRFDPATLQIIGKAAVANHGDNVEPLLRQVVDGLQVAYPRIVESYDNARWVFNVAGGATGQMMILHASLTEYLIFFGSASGTEGHSGAHFAHDYFTILTGQQTAAFLGELKPRVYLPGDQHHHPQFTAAHYTIGNGTWSLELAQGFIPAMLPFGLIQMPMSLDVDSLLRTVFYTGRSVVSNLLKGKI